MTILKGWIYCALWYSSILAGYTLLFCPLLPVLFISNRFYRYITDILFTFWQYYPTALLEIICGCHVQVTGDAIRTGELSLLLMNHRTRTDWNFVWPTVYHCVEGKGKLSHSTKFILKDQIRHIPGPGWIMQLACFIYIRRCWQLDQVTLKRYVDYVSDINYKHSLLIFPEGTDLTVSTKKSSDNFALKNDLPLYNHVLHPKTTGFVYLAKQLLHRNRLDAVYDITLIYPDTIPQNEKWLLNGKFPSIVKIHLVRYSKSVLPTTEEGLKQFLEKRWFDKEKTIKEFTTTGNFLRGEILKCERKSELYLAFMFWTLLPYLSLYLFLTTSWLMAIVIVHTLFLLIVNLYCQGFQNFEILLFLWKKRLDSFHEKKHYQNKQ